MASFSITPEFLKSYPLPVTDAQWAKVGDAKITAVSAYAADHIEDWLDRSVLSANVEDRLKGTGMYTMMLSTWPVTSITSIKSYDNLYNETTEDLDEIYVNDSSGILEWKKRGKYSFYKSKIYVVSYVAGYSSVPGPIIHATALQTVKMLQPLFRGGTSFVETELIMELDEQIVELLDPYKRRRIG